MVKGYKDFVDLFQFTMSHKLELIILLCFWLESGLSKPIQKTDSESIAKRLNSELQDIIKLSVLDADMKVLRTLPEAKLSVLENLLKLWQEEAEEQPQADEPMEDVYLSDAPSSSGDVRVEVEETATLSSYEPANNSKTYRDIPDSDKTERNKEIRLNTIKSQILTYLGFAGRPTPVVNSTEEERQQMMDMYEKMKHSASHPASDSFTEKVQSFYPTCDLPRNTTSDLWNNNGTVMNLFFNNIQAVLSTSNVLKAKLRLYKHSRSAENLVVAEEGCTHNQDEKKKGDGETKTVEDRLIRVSIYWYTRPLKKSKDKKKLLDSQMLSIYGEEWTEWNIKPAVKAWKETPSKNFGLSVIVEDEDGVKLPVDKLFAAMNCSNEASTARPFPGFFVHPNRENVEFQSGGQVSLPWAGSPAYNTPVFPIIDLCSVSNETDKHKLRHHNHHREQRSH